MPRAARAKDTKTAAKGNEKTKKKGKDQSIQGPACSESIKNSGFFCNRQEDFDAITLFLTFWNTFSKKLNCNSMSFQAKN